MNQTENFSRGDALGFEKKMLPAKTYNAMRTLLDYSESSCVFVPIRSMQYMAVIDQEEVIFVDAISARRSIEFSWQHFKPQLRTALIEPVSYQFTYYDLKAIETMKRAQSEFNHFVQQMMSRTKDKLKPNRSNIVQFDPTKR